MARHISLIQLYEDNREKLMLNWVIGQRVDRRIEIKLSSNYGADVVGHINIIHPVIPDEPVQIHSTAFANGIPAQPAAVHRVKMPIAIVKQSGDVVGVLRGKPIGVFRSGGACGARKRRPRNL